MAPIPERPAASSEGERPRRRHPGAIWLAALVALAAVGLCWLLVRGFVGLFDYQETDPAWEQDAFVLTGEFRADGGCTVLLDGQPVASADTPRTDYEHDTALNMTPDGLSVHQVSCEIGKQGGAGAPYDPRSFWVWGPVRTGDPLRPGRYRVVEEALEPGDTTAMEMALFHPRFEENGERAYLVGYRGYVRVVKVDSPTVVGTFRIVARRKRRSPFS
jgi:hypothetical protein